MSSTAQKPIKVEYDLDVRAIRKRFLAINRERLRRTEEALRWRTRDFLDLLPLLFHINHALLPGWVSKAVPAGISAWTITKKSLDAAKRQSKSFDYKKRALRTYDIHSIFLIGSVGTIAHSEKSDFDIWICHRPGMSEEEKDLLSQKCVGIEQWADSVNLEVHFFLMDAEEFREGDVVELSSESSGSTQHHLLLEEFYRTGLLVAGRFPAWWLVPPDKEADYEEVLHRLISRRFIPANEVIDFGGLSAIPAEEFFGAALWQVYKGIDSPYKSVLKMLLMEAYAAEYPRSDLLSLRYKRAIYEGVTDLDALDPYTILLEKLEQFLQSRDEPERLDLVRRCFYFKVQLPLSKPQSTKQGWRWDRTWELAKRWGWSGEQVEVLDNRHDWNVYRVLKERKVLVDEITHSYMALSNFARSRTNLARIEQRDLNILGRKLYAAFERKAGKIETINRGISANIVEERIAIQQRHGKNNEESWSLYPNTGEPGNSGSALKRTRSIVELLAWCYFNGLVGPRTIISLTISSGVLSLKEVRSILDTFQSLFPEGRLPPVQIENYSQPPRILNGSIFANVGIDPLPSHTRRGTGLVSDQSDVMNYSGFSLNLALTFDLLVVTSWQEIITYKYKGIEGLLDCLGQCLRWNVSAETDEPPPVHAFSFSSSHSIAIARRVKQLYHDISSVFFRRPDTDSIRYVLQVEQYYYLLMSEQGTFRYVRQANYEELIETLSEPYKGSGIVMVDRLALLNSPLPAILRHNRLGVIQMFYLTKDKLADVYVLDEDGAVFHQTTPYFEDGALLNQYSRFFEAVLNRQDFLYSDGQASVLLNTLEIYKITKGRSNKFGFERQSIETSVRRRNYFNVQLIGDTSVDSSAVTIFCNEEEFSSLDHGVEVFREVASYVLKQRASGLRYPIYITDVDLSPGMLKTDESDRVRVIEYLKYKKRIETKLNNELAQL
jgi:adenylate cyclase class 1